MKFIRHIGQYYLLVAQVFRKPEKTAMYYRQFLREIEAIGINSLGITVIISIFMGAVITIQTAFGLSALIPAFTVGYITRDSVILEFAPTILCLILAGKVGSNIASEIGTMRVTEQIDALEIMGVNAASYLILPKILSAMFIFPFLVLFSMVLSIFGGYLAGIFTGCVTEYDFLYGITYYFRPFNVTYAMIKTEFFAFIIASVSSYHGYFVEGGAREVGSASTRAVVYSNILILLFNVLLTQLLLA